VELIRHYFPDLSPTQVSAFAIALELYPEKNNFVNVISRKDISFLEERHFLHSLSIALFYNFNPGTRLLDVGTGGGFPGLPLAILFPECEFTLLDSIGKKIHLAREIAQAAGIKNVQFSVQRAEDHKAKYDFVLSRAVTRMKPFVGWVKKNVRCTTINPEVKSGILYLKGGDLAEELAEAEVPYVVHPLNTKIDLPFFETKQLVHVSLCP
jgi:16S rRNA (guanine527-N7)-methyltransferase